jgi:hypothetical protein
MESRHAEIVMITKNWLKGMVAGFVATVVRSAFMLMKQQMGMMPELNPIQMMTSMPGASSPALATYGLERPEQTYGYQEARY